MLGSFLNRLLILAFGYAYPAYECFKVVEKNKPDIENLRFWCQYWILVALLTAFERVGDFFISWLPLYHEAKLGFFIYLWLPKTKGTAYVYESLLQPLLSQNENEIDRALLEFRARAADFMASFFQKFATFGHAKFVEILQFVMWQSQSIGSRYSQREQQSQPQQQEEDVPRAPPMVRPRRPSSGYEAQQQQRQRPYNSASARAKVYAAPEDDAPPPDFNSRPAEAREASSVGNGEDAIAEHGGRSKKTE